MEIPVFHSVEIPWAEYTGTTLYCLGVLETPWKHIN